MSLDFDSARLHNPNLTEEHQQWRDQLRRFLDREVVPFAEDWDEEGWIPDDLWPKAAEVGIVGWGTLRSLAVFLRESICGIR